MSARGRSSGTWSVSVRPLTRVHDAHRTAVSSSLGPVGSGSRIPFGLLGALCLIVMIESSISKRWLVLSDPVGLSWLFSAQAAKTLAPSADLLCLGDSLVKHGIIPSVIGAESGLSAVNLSAARAPTLMTYYFFRQALDAGSRPRAIIVNAKPAVLMGDPSFNGQYWPYALTLGGLADFTLRTRRPQLIAATILARAIPSVRSRLQLRSNTLSAFKGLADTLGTINPVLWRNWTVNAGANVARGKPHFDGNLPADIEQLMHPNTFFAHPSNRLALTQLFQLACERGIHVYLLIPPISPPLQSMRDKSGSDRKYDEFLGEYQRRFGRNMTVLDARRGGFDNADLVDATHLNEQGAIALSRCVATVIRTDTPGSVSRWLQLFKAASSPVPHGLPIEDLEQSRLRARGPADDVPASHDHTLEPTRIERKSFGGMSRPPRPVRTT